MANAAHYLVLKERRGRAALLIRRILGLRPRGKFLHFSPKLLTLIILGSLVYKANHQERKDFEQRYGVCRLFWNMPVARSIP